MGLLSMSKTHVNRLKMTIYLGLFSAANGFVDSGTGSKQDTARYKQLNFRNREGSKLIASTNMLCHFVNAWKALAVLAK